MDLKTLLQSDVRKDQQKAFVKLYRDYGSMLKQHLRKLQGAKKLSIETDDFIQLVMLAVYTNVRNGKYNPDGNLGGYLKQIANFIYLKWVRDKRLETTGFDQVSHAITDEETATGPNYVATGWEHLSWTEFEQMQLIYREVDSFSKQDQEIFYGFYEKNMKQQEIAAQIGKDVNWVKSTLFRIRQKLIKRLNPKPVSSTKQQTNSTTNLVGKASLIASRQI